MNSGHECIDYKKESKNNYQLKFSMKFQVQKILRLFITCDNLTIEFKKVVICLR